MRIDKHLWEKALLFAEECKRRSISISHPLVAKQFGVKERTARFLVNALENIDLLQFKPSAFKTNDGDLELVLTDIHLPYQDDLAIETALEYAEPLQPNIITLLGDTIDFYQISSFIRNPTKPRLGQELVEGKEFFQELRKRFPNARIIYKEGNHEDRWSRYIYTAAKEIYELVDNLFVDRLGLTDVKVEYHKQPFRIGKLWHLHGHEHMSKTYSPEHVTNVVWKYVHDHFICGHYHRNQEKTYKRGLSNEQFWGGVLGYLAGEMDYAQLNAWSQGFALIRYNNAGNFRAEIRRIHNGEVY